MNRIFADISNNNSDRHFNFEAYREAGHRVIGIKATEGIGFIDPFHDQWCARAHQKAKLHVIHYHFGHVGQSPQTQGEFFWAHVKPRFGRNDFLCIDIEGGGVDGHGIDATAAWTNDFANHLIKVSGHHPVGYSNESELRELVKAGVRLPTNRWWIAAYGPSRPSIGGVKTWAWQYSNGVIGPQPHEAPGVGKGDMSKLNRGTALRLRFARV